MLRLAKLLCILLLLKSCDFSYFQALEKERKIFDNPFYIWESKEIKHIQANSKIASIT